MHSHTFYSIILLGFFPAENFAFSPCRVQNVYLNDKIVGSIQFTAPRSTVYGFTLAITFYWRTNENTFRLTRLGPEITLNKNSKPLSIMEDITTGKKIEVLIHYPNILTDFRVHSVHIGDDFVCSENYGLPEGQNKDNFIFAKFI